MPPDREIVFAYSSVRYDRHTPAAPRPPSGPSPSRPVNMCWNMALRNIVSKSWAVARAFAFGSRAALPAAAVLAAAAASPSAPSAFAGPRPKAVITSPRYQPGWRPHPSHHLDISLDGAHSLDRLQDGNHVARADAERIEPVHHLLQRHAFVDERELLAVLLHAHPGARHDPGLAA